MRFFNTEDPVQSDRHLLFAAPASSGQWRPRSGAGIRHWFRADPLGKSSQNQNDFCAGVVGTGPDGTRKDICSLRCSGFWKGIATSMRFVSPSLELHPFADLSA